VAPSHLDPNPERAALEHNAAIAVGQAIEQRPATSAWSPSRARVSAGTTTDPVAIKANGLSADELVIRADLPASPEYVGNAAGSLVVNQ
jgi:hypothetical protein